MHLSSLNRNRLVFYILIILKDKFTIKMGTQIITTVIEQQQKQNIKEEKHFVYFIATAPFTKIVFIFFAFSSGISFVFCILLHELKQYYRGVSSFAHSVYLCELNTLKQSHQMLSRIFFFIYTNNTHKIFQWIWSIAPRTTKGLHYPLCLSIYFPIKNTKEIGVVNPIVKKKQTNEQSGKKMSNSSCLITFCCAQFLGN